MVSRRAAVAAIAPVAVAPRAVARAACAVLACAVLAACGPDVAGAPAPAPVAATPTAPPMAELWAAMLAPADIGQGVTASNYRPSGREETFTCGQPGLAARFETAQAGAALMRGEELLVIEAVHVFSGVTGARQGYAAVGEGFGCGAGTTLDGTPATIGAARNVTAEVGGDQAQAWTVDAQGASVVVVSVQAHEAVIVFSVVAAAGVDPATVPDAVAVARTGVAKLLAA